MMPLRLASYSSGVMSCCSLSTLSRRNRVTVASPGSCSTAGWTVASAVFALSIFASVTGCRRAGGGFRGGAGRRRRFYRAGADRGDELARLYRIGVGGSGRLHRQAAALVEIAPDQQDVAGILPRLVAQLLAELGRVVEGGDLQGEAVPLDGAARVVDGVELRQPGVVDILLARAARRLAVGAAGVAVFDEARRRW